MWWLIPLAAVGLYSYFSTNKTSEEEKASERWEKRRKNQLQKIEKLRIEIETKVRQDKLNSDFITLTELHFNSFIVSDETYKLLEDAKIVLEHLTKIIEKAKEQIDSLLKKRNKSTDYKSSNEIKQEIEIIQDQKITFQKNYELCKVQKNNLYEELKKLNTQTSLLKYIIRDKCGLRGVEWYEKLEARKNRKRQ